MKPGDWIEFVHQTYFTPVRKEEKMWSTLMNKWIPIYGNFLFISDSNKEISVVLNGIIYQFHKNDTRLFVKDKCRAPVEIKKIDKLGRK
jgi:hypothetical protein